MQLSSSIWSYSILLLSGFLGGAFVQVLFSGWTWCNCTQGRCTFVAKKPAVKNCPVPPLVGIILLPLILNNAAPQLFEGLQKTASSLLKRGAIEIILFQAGLGLDLRAIPKIYRPVLKLAFLPQLAEAMIAALFAHLLFDMPGRLALAFGYLLAGGSPSICVPLANSLQAGGFGVAHNIPAVIVLAVTIDAMFALAIVDFLVSWEFAADSIFGAGPGAAIGLGLFEFIAPLVAGAFFAFVLSSLFRKCNRIAHPDVPANCAEIFEFSVILAVAMAGSFIPSLLWELNNFGFLCVVATNAALRLLWREGSARKTAVFNRLAGKLFMVGRYFLFGLIGVAVNLRSADGDTLRMVIAVVLAGLAFRAFTAYFVNSCCERMPRKARLSVALVWMGKATVQVAAGGLVSYKESHFSDRAEYFGEHFEALSVIAILICAPLAGVLGGSLSKRWLPVGDSDKVSSFGSGSTVTPDPDRSPDSQEESSDASSHSDKDEVEKSIDEMEIKV